MKGPDRSTTNFGEWSDGLQRTRLYEQILLDIILGDLAPMTVLDERMLSQRYSGGVAGVREALGRLALEGLVVRRPRVGTVVAPLDIGEIEQAFEVRRLLEARSAALAALNASSADIAAITGAFEGAEAAIADGDLRALLAMDRHFHRAVAIATGNGTLARFIIALQNVATRFWVWAMKKQSAEDQLRDVALHRELAAAIAARDAAAAEACADKLVDEPPTAFPPR